MEQTNFGDVVEAMLNPLADTMGWNGSCSDIPITSTFNREDSVIYLNYTYPNYEGGGNLSSWPTWEIVLKCASYALILILAVVGNILVILIVVRNKRMRSTTNFYLVNLAVAGLAIALFCMWPNLTISFVSGWPFGQWFCKANTLFQMMSLIASVITLTTISIDRFFAVFWPLKVRITQQRASVVIALTWILAGAVSLPLPIYRKYREVHWLDYVERVCQDEWPQRPIYDENCTIITHSSPGKTAYHTFISLAMFFFPVVVICMAYSLIVWKLWVNIVPGEQHNAVLELQAKAKRKVTKLVLVVIVAFIVCWLPLQVLLLYDLLRKRKGVLPEWTKAYWFFAHFMAYADSALNPIIYGSFNDNFRKGFLQIFRCVCRRGHTTGDLIALRTREDSSFINSAGKRIINGRKNTQPSILLSTSIPDG